MIVLLDGVSAGKVQGHGVSSARQRTETPDPHRPQNGRGRGTPRYRGLSLPKYWGVYATWASSASSGSRST